MSSTADLCISRRLLLAGLGSLAATPAWAAAPVVTLLGDSITAGWGLPKSASLPARLEAELRRLGKAATVRGAGVSGDTTSGGLKRIDFSVRKDTAVCVVALGGNDLLMGEEPRVVRANLQRIIRKLQARGVTVVLAGMRAPEQLGGAYAREFNAVFRELARTKGVISYPNLLDGVAGIRSLNQRDGIHPNAAGVKVIARRLAPVVARALAVRR
ncbi:MAG TPA: arylesterase [Caulobacteraceae bacterium]|nr:arylesterase [Caulobacteraceae bacterium]